MCSSGRVLMGRVLEQRRSDTQRRLDELRSELTESPALIADKACVYVTGSGGRGEMSSHSDLDLFIVSDIEEAKPRLRRLDAIVVRAELIKATRKRGFPEFSPTMSSIATSLSETAPPGCLQNSRATAT